ncbi:MAG: hypothetical protein ACRDRW_01135 [Pseudonocardiaceae bacterium]
MSGDPAPASAAHPVSGPGWGVSSRDWQSHAVDVDAEHPDGVYVARCGQRLVMGASLYDEPPPGGWMCLACTRWTDRGDIGEVTEPTLARPGREEGGVG